MSAVGSAGLARVAHVDAETAWGGGEEQVLLLLRGLAARGHAQLLIVPPGAQLGERVRAAADLPGVELAEVPMQSDLSLRAPGAIARALREHASDVVHLHSGRATWLGALGARRAGLPALTTRRMAKRMRPHLRNRRVYRHWLGRVVGIAPAVVELLRELGVPEERLALVPDGVDPEALAAGAATSGLRAALGVPAERLVVAALATLAPHKGLDVLVRAFAQVLDNDGELDAELWLAGRGEQRDALERLAAELGIAERVRLLGFQPREQVLGGCDVVCMPSRLEGLGVAALEAMAIGLPVCASRVGGLGEAIEHGVSGLLSMVGDVEQLARHLEQTLYDAELRERLGAGGRRRVLERFTAEAMVRSYVELYAQLLND